MNDILIIQRHVNERTRNISKSILNKHTNLEIFDISSITFHDNLISSYKLALEVRKEWTLFIDGDVIPNKTILEFLDLRHKLSDDYLGYSPLITDKFWLENRFGGLHLYRTSSLQNVFQVGMNNFENSLESFYDLNRPESYFKKIGIQLGYAWGNVKLICGLHDYHQEYFDIYRKSFLYASKFTNPISKLLPTWKDFIADDKDFDIAILGFADGLRSLNSMPLSLDDFRLIWSNYEINQGIKSKGALSQLEVNKILNYASLNKPLSKNILFKKKIFGKENLAPKNSITYFNNRIWQIGFVNVVIEITLILINKVKVNKKNNDGEM
jgi:hypothetical protein